MKTQLTIGAGICGFCAGLLVAGGMGNNPLKTVSVAGLVSLPTIFVANLLIDTKAQNLINEAQSTANKAELKANNAESELSKIKLLLTARETYSNQLQQRLSQVEALLKSSQSDRNNLAGMVEQLNPLVNQLQTQLSEAKEQVAELEDEVEAWEVEFNSRVDVEVDRRFQKAKRVEIDRIFAEHDAITSEAMALFRELQQWGYQVAESHRAKRQLITDLASSYNRNLDELNESVDREREALLTQIECLRDRIGQLQHELNGELLEPELNPGFGWSVEGRIANDLAKEIFSTLQIPLVVKGFYVRPDGSTEVGYGYSRSIEVTALVETLKRHSDHLAKRLGIHRITAIKKLEYADLLVVTFRREPAVKESDINLCVGTAGEFISYVTSHPIRYRLIADPGMSKTPTTAVMISEILKVGCKRGNVSKGTKVPHTLVTVSYPGVQSSLKDSDYPLDLFLKYGTETAAIKSFDDAVSDWEYRKQNLKYSEQFFQVWVWDELDNTLNSASDPQSVANNLKKILKQAGHNNVGWIVSGQSVMTKQIPGFTNDDRSLFTEIIIGIPKIRHYLNTYGKGKNSDFNLAKLSRNLEQIEDYIEHKNELITDEARLLRVALVVDFRSPKLYFLPNLDQVAFDTTVLEETRRLALEFRDRHNGMSNSESVPGGQPKLYADSSSSLPSPREKSPIGVQESKAHCPECGSGNVKLQSQNRYKCNDCGVRRVESKMVWK